MALPQKNQPQGHALFGGCREEADYSRLVSACGATLWMVVKSGSRARNEIQAVSPGPAMRQQFFIQSMPVGTNCGFSHHLAHLVVDPFAHAQAGCRPKIDDLRSRVGV